MSVHKYNLKNDLSEHENPQRPSYAVGDEGGLLLCSWPKGENCLCRLFTVMKYGRASNTRWLRT